uniref:Ig-like domain-containing protein n=1 Tax=Gasterosteus aculeatus aculeatus TaxID=481459 RepID=A0AAQ4PL60_GASAC
MTSAKFIFYLTCLFLGKMVQTTDLDSSSSVHQGNSFLSVQTGGNLTLKCIREAGTAAKLYWFKHTLGQKPRLISSSYRFTIPTFYAEFKNPRFTVDTENDQNHLRIIDLQINDSATYYCVSSKTHTFDFTATTTVSVQGSSSNIPTLIHQSPSETIQPGGSVTLNCTVQTGTCDGQHSVYWFKDSEESHPALIYTDGGSTDQCERKPNTQTHTCDYNLPMESLNPSHAGTYYCAVASCGHILFGDGTKLDFKDEVDSPFVVYLLSGALVFSNILVVLLALSVCMMNKTDSCQSTGNCSCLYLAAGFHLMQLFNSRAFFLFLRISSKISCSLQGKCKALPKQRNPVLCSFKCPPAQRIKKTDGSDLE